MASEKNSKLLVNAHCNMVKLSYSVKYVFGCDNFFKILTSDFLFIANSFTK